jgi:hypothetical protein
MVKKEVFEWIRTGQKTIELMRGRAREGEKAVFQCGRNILRGIIDKKEEGSLTDVLRQDNSIVAKSLSLVVLWENKLLSGMNLCIMIWIDICQKRMR